MMVETVISRSVRLMFAGGMAFAASAYAQDAQQAPGQAASPCNAWK
ncbi:MAG: hypothetical protein ACREWI_17930 [Telluria sp.]